MKNTLIGTLCSMLFILDAYCKTTLTQVHITLKLLYGKFKLNYFLYVSHYEELAKPCIEVSTIGLPVPFYAFLHTAVLIG